MNEMDNADWQFNNPIQTGKNRWSKLSEKFWRVPGEIKNRRYVLCKECDQLIPATTQCKKCLCAMGIKTWMGGFACPPGKWQKETRKQAG